MMELLWLSRWLHMRWQDFGSGRRCVTEGSAVLKDGIVAVPHHPSAVATQLSGWGL